MVKALSAFNFGPSLIHWIQTFYKKYYKHSYEQWLYNNSFSNISRLQTRRSVWNNKHICVDNKSIFYRSLFEKGIITLENLVSESNNLIVKQFSNNSHFTHMEVFLLMQVIDALPLQWQNSLALCGQKSDRTFVLLDHVKLRLKDQEVLIVKAASKDIHGEIRSKYETTPTVQAKYTEQYSSGCV